MKQEDIFEQDRESLFHADEEESKAEIFGDESSLDSLSSSPLSRRNSDSNQWPRSYRESVNMLTGITPPTKNSLISFFNKKEQSSVLDSFTSSTSKELLLNQDDDVHNSAVISIKSFLASHLKLSVPSLSFLPDENRTCSFSQSVFNGINILVGTAVLTIPYTLKEGGWLGLIVLFCFGIITCYTGILLQRCLESSPGLYTYLDIGQAAFGISGRIFISIFLSLESYGSCVEYIIMMSDNLSGLFPTTSLDMAGFSLDSKQIFAIATILIVLPTAWLRDLSLLSYLSAGGVLSSILLAICLFWVGFVDEVGFRITGQALDLTNLPIAVGIFGFGFAGHSVFPNVYSSMKEPSRFPLVLLTSFGLSTLFYIGIAVCGYTMFGDAIQSQFTLNMPQQFTSSKVAIWTAVVTPMMKVRISNHSSRVKLRRTLAVYKRDEIQNRLFDFQNHFSSIYFGGCTRISILCDCFGSFVAMLLAFIFPCLCYLKISKGRLTNIDTGICIVIVIIGVVSGCCGTYSAIA